MDGGPDFATAYLENFDALSDELEARLVEHPSFAGVLAKLTAEQRAPARAEARGRLERAFAGEWEPYAQGLRSDGASYAAQGIPFADWHALASAWSKHMLPCLVGRFGHDALRLIAVLLVHQEFVERSMSVMGEAYLLASQSRLQRSAHEVNRWETLFERIGWGICVVDASGQTLVHANAAFLKTYGFTSHDPTRTLASLFVPEDLVRVRRDVTPLAEQHGSATYETIHVRADGTKFPVLVEAVQIPDLDGKLAWAMAVHDLSERHQNEALRLRATQLEADNRRVQEASRLKSEFLANMSHELRTPLNSILGFAELLHNGDVGPLEDQQKEFVGDIHTSGKHLLRLINDILDLSKVEAGKLEFHPEDASLSALTSEVARALRGAALAQGITLQLRVAPDIDAVLLDTGRLKQVLYNYLSNALKFGPRGSTVSVTASRESETAFRLEVQDHGPGIAAADQDRLFKEFEQIDAERAKIHTGTGLGLALTRRLVEAQGGVVGVRSAAGEGSLFFAVLPLRSPLRVSAPQPRSLAGAHVEAPRVLVIEDEPADQERLVSLLLLAGYAVDTASTGAQALRAIEAQTYQAITLDLILPDMSGLAILQAIRKSPGHEAVPVIVTAVSDDEVTAAFAVQEVLKKPLHPEDLRACLDRLAMRQLGPGPILVVDDDEASTRLMVTSLKRLGFQVLTARDGVEGLAHAEATTPCAVILDLVMPNLDGFGFLREFRARTAWLNVPVLVWTTQDLSQEQLDVLMESATGILPKDGCGAQALLDAIRTQLPRRRRIPV